ncbi:MAG: hypothetical protein JSR71_11410 [Proteobacteria bacterium]|nr:hypothetical protein [Pseudomonadota bacterium]
MKRFFLGLTILVAAVSSAFTLLPGKHKSNANKQASLYWFVGGAYTGRQNTHSVEQPLSGCPDVGSIHCEDGYDSNDLKDPSDPSKGLKAGATINDFIRKQ